MVNNVFYYGTDGRNIRIVEDGRDDIEEGKDEVESKSKLKT